MYFDRLVAVQVGASNLLANGGFEDGLGPAIGWAGSGTVDDSAPAQEGSNYLVLDAPGGFSVLTSSQRPSCLICRKLSRTGSNAPPTIRL